VYGRVVEAQGDDWKVELGNTFRSNTLQVVGVINLSKAEVGVAQLSAAGLYQQWYHKTLQQRPQCAFWP
jgi:hypothetical protein